MPARVDGVSLGPSGTHAERSTLAELRPLFEAAEGEHRLEGFVTSTSRMGEVAVHALLLALVGLLALRWPLAAVVLGLFVLASLLLEARRGPIFGQLYPRQRAYNLLYRRGAGSRRVVAFSFVDRPRRYDALVRRARAFLGAVGAGAISMFAFELATGALGPALRLVPVLALGLTGLVMLAMARSQRTLPSEPVGLAHLVSLLDVEPPEDTQLIVVACSAGHPRLEGLQALLLQHPEWTRGETRFLPLDPSGRSARWLAARGLGAVQLEEARALIGYAEADDLDLDRSEPGRHAVRDRERQPG